MSMTNIGAPGMDDSDAIRIGDIHPMQTEVAIAQQEPKYRVAITENSKGEPAVSVRAVADDAGEAVNAAVNMYNSTLRELGIDRKDARDD